MDSTNLIVIGVLVVVAILVFKLLTKSIFRLAGIAIIVVLGTGYLYFYTNYFEEHKDNKIVQAIEKKIDIVSLKEFEKNHCKGKEMSHNDSIKCLCIVQPLLKDLRSKYSEAELDKLIKNKQQYLKELLAALKRNQAIIVRKLEEHKATHFWNDMMRDLRKGKFLKN